MEIEKLTKQQIVLVTLLVSFVTSIATGIVTVSLMEQAPPGVTQTINRIVERTVERVVPDTTQSKVVTKETVVIREDDLAAKAIEKNAKSIIRIFEVSGSAGKERFAALGVVIARNGTILTDSAMLAAVTDEWGNVATEKYFARLADGANIPLVLIGTDAETRVTLFKPVKEEGKSLPHFDPVILADSDSLRLGQAVIAVGGEKSNEIATGVLTGFVQSETASSTDTSKPKNLLLKTNVVSEELLPGSILINLSGDVVGIKNSDQDRGVFTASNRAGKAAELFAEAEIETNAASAIKSAEKLTP